MQLRWAKMETDLLKTLCQVEKILRFHRMYHQVLQMQLYKYQKTRKKTDLIVLNLSLLVEEAEISLTMNQEIKTKGSLYLSRITTSLIISTR